MPGPPLHSLVKYDTPSLLTTKDKKSKAGAKGGKKLPPVETKQPLTQTEDILNSILPPRCAHARRRRTPLPPGPAGDAGAPLFPPPGGPPGAPCPVAVRAGA